MFGSFLIGTQFVMALYNLLFYFKVKDKSYIYYAIHLMSNAGYAGFCWLRINEDLKDSVLPGGEYYFDHLALFTTLGMIGYVYFIRTYLNLAALSKTWDKVMKWLGYLGWIIFVPAVIFYSIPGWGKETGTGFAVFYVMVSSIVGLAFFVPLFRWRKQVNTFFIMGFYGLAIGAVISVLLRIANVSFFFYFIEVGVLLEAVFFTLALADKQQKKDKDRVQALLELELAENQRKLDKLENARIKEVEEVRNSFYTNITLSLIHI